MIKRKFLFSLLAFISLINSFVPKSFAVTSPSFPSCSAYISSPVLASYSSGTHGIVGSNATYTGSDKVYAIDGTNQVTQCFCADNGNGTQSNWWKVTHLTDEEIKILVSQGWKYVVSGLAWGLSDVEYLVFNSSYACLGRGGGADVLGSSTIRKSVLGLAATGNPISANPLFFTGALSTLFGLHLFLKRKQVS